MLGRVYGTSQLRTALGRVNMGECIEVRLGGQILTGMADLILWSHITSVPNALPNRVFLSIGTPPPSQ
jgi:hypothetical protein